MALALGAWFRRRDGDTPARGRLPVPWFIAGFIAISAVFTFAPSLQPLAKPVAFVSRGLLTVTLFLIGTGLSRGVLRTVGTRPLVLAVLLWIVIGSATLGAIMTGLIH